MFDGVLPCVTAISVAETEIHHSVITMDGPQIANQYRLRLHEHFQGPFGFGTPDDSEAWERVQHGANAGNDLWIMLNRGLPGEVKTEDGLKVMSVLKQVCAQHTSSGKR